jgi:excinuclease ABC subunit A
MNPTIAIRNARLHNLKNVTLEISKNKLVVLTGLSPSISADQHLANHSPRSKVGTATEIFTYLKVLYARLGHRPCPSCGKNVLPSTG